MSDQPDQPGVTPLPSEEDTDEGGHGHMTRKLQFNVPARLEEVRAIAESLRAFMAVEVPETERDAIELGIVEALTNIVAHGYTGLAQAAMELRYAQSADAVIVEVIDSGSPIPNEHWQREADAPFNFDADNLAELPEHGMGLALIRLSFDVVNYESAGGINRLTMAKRFGTTEDIARSDD